MHVDRSVRRRHGRRARIITSKISLCRFVFRTWNPAHYMNIDNVVALLFFLDFFPNVGFGGVAPTRPLVSESFQRPPRDTGEDVHVRVLEPVRSRTPAYIQFVSVSTC